MKKSLLLAYVIIAQIFNAHAQVTVDAEMIGITTPQFIAAPTSAEIAFDVTNTGADTITMFNAEWTDGTATYSQTFTTNLGTSDIASFIFTDLLAVVANSFYAITVSITDVNGAGVDDDPNNDFASKTINGMDIIPTKIVVGEEGTGMWCGWCPRGWDYMDYMTVNHSSNWIGIAVHNNDLLTDPIYDASMNATISGYPTGHVDRAVLDIDPTSFETAFIERMAMVPPAGISVDWILNGGAIDVTVTADFATTVTADYRLNCVVIENGIQDNSYDQATYYENDPLIGYGYDWQFFSNPAPGDNLIYSRVARAILGGWDGEVGSVPSSVTNGQQVSYSWSYMVPAGSNIDNLEFIGMLIDQSTGEILNAGSVSTTASLEEEMINFDVNIYPNPSSSIVNIALELNEASEVSLEVLNTTGQLVNSKSYGMLSGEHVLFLNSENLDSGVYFVELSVGGKNIRKKVTILK